MDTWDYIYSQLKNENEDETWKIRSCFKLEAISPFLHPFMKLFHLLYLQNSPQYSCKEFHCQRTEVCPQAPSALGPWGRADTSQDSPFQTCSPGNTRWLGWNSSSILLRLRIWTIFVKLVSRSQSIMSSFPTNWFTTIINVLLRRISKYYRFPFAARQ